MTDISIPVTHRVMLLLMSTGALFFGKLKLALLVHDLFTLYWGHGINKEFLVSSGYPHMSGFTILFLGFGLVIAVVGWINLVFEPGRKA